jgi:hypothetical protein
MIAESNQSHGLQEGSRLPSPFSKVLALDYYDGPTRGVVEVSPEKQPYRFEILAWDTENLNLRVFSLAQLPSDTLTRLTDAYSRFWEPRWPIWVPIWHFSNAADEEAMDQLTKELMGQASAPSWIVAATDLLGEILVARKTTPKELDQVPDWPFFLGLADQAVDLPARNPHANKEE